MLAIVLCAALVIAGLAPETPLGRGIRSLLIDIPARKLSSFRGSHWLAAFIGAAVIAGLIATGKVEAMLLGAQAVPGALSWFAAFDVATYMDAVGLLVLIAATARLRATYLVLRSVAVAGARQMLRTFRNVTAARSHRASRRAHARRSKPSVGSKDDDRRWPTFAFSLA